MDLSPTFDAWHFCPWVTYLMTYASLIKFLGLNMMSDQLSAEPDLYEALTNERKFET